MKLFFIVSVLLAGARAQDSSSSSLSSSKMLEFEARVDGETDLLKLADIMNKPDGDVVSLADELQLVDVDALKNNSITKPLYDFKNVQVSMKIYIGSNLQPFYMIFDTGSAWLWVTHRSCYMCNPIVPRFDERSSTTFSFYPAIYDLHYGTGDAYGYYSVDQICLTAKDCDKEFVFATVYTTSKLASLHASGIIGMSPSEKNLIGDLFLVKLRKAGIIDRSMFSIYVDFKNK